MTNVYIPKNVSDAIKDYDEIKAARSEAVATHTTKAEQLADELAQEKGKLTSLMDETLRNPTAANEKKETACRKRVAEIEMALNGAQERAKRARQMNGEDEKQAAIKAIQTAKQAADDRYNAEVDDKLKAIESAKLAYLEALKDYGQLRYDCKELVNETARQTNNNYRDKVGSPRAANHSIAWNHRDHAEADGNKYTVFPEEMNNALDHRIVKTDGRKA
ncbi:hypothetical protein [Salicibibacter kimchii]|uniref:Uncharacterized protein n=1 Tax=Salicibibacter kimchii TaxID=2099786 RepID=A0A345BV24_9BACI|nr:hypothetical protein [Salicibibacter kimchii]AXF54805.1 hypothetical protein DT065_01415 [Salicibibacter kimchii]